MKVPLYAMTGEKSGETDLPKEVFDVPMNADLLAQAVRVQKANQRRPLAHTKDRGEVRGGGRKPWRQKGTGRARHGSIRSPIWRGGGTTFGPRKDHQFQKELSEGMRRRALAVALSAKLRDGEVAVLDRFELAQAKTKLMAQALSQITSTVFGATDRKKGGPTIVLALPITEQHISRATRNLPRVRQCRAENLTVLDVLSSRYFIFSKDAIPLLKARVAKRKGGMSRRDART
ncbi:MAG: 50S ribosomal protein L4 [Candidatus Terrybacteria bacterium]|nr:50S ribosomal protein L4 [Candidatus Terrybacteria bacterium]